MLSVAVALSALPKLNGTNGSVDDSMRFRNFRTCVWSKSCLLEIVAFEK